MVLTEASRCDTDQTYVAFCDEVDAVRAEIAAIPIDRPAATTRLDNANMLKIVPMRAVSKESVCASESLQVEPSLRLGKFPVHREGRESRWITASTAAAARAAISGSATPPSGCSTTAMRAFGRP